MQPLTDGTRDTMDGPRVPSFEGIFLLRRSLLALMLALAVTACGGGDDNPNGPSTPPPQGPANLVIEDLTVGTGAEATGGRLLNVNYNLYHYDPAGNGGRGALIQGPAPYSVPAGDERDHPGLRAGHPRHARRRYPPHHHSPVACVRRWRQHQTPALQETSGSCSTCSWSPSSTDRRYSSHGMAPPAPPNRVAATSPAMISTAPITFHRSIGSPSQIAAVPTAATGIRFE